MHLSEVCVGMQAAQGVLVLNKGLIEGRLDECFPKPAHTLHLKDRGAFIQCTSCWSQASLQTTPSHEMEGDHASAQKKEQLLNLPEAVSMLPTSGVQGHA